MVWKNPQASRPYPLCSHQNRVHWDDRHWWNRERTASSIASAEQRRATFSTVSSGKLWGLSISLDKVDFISNFLHLYWLFLVCHYLFKVNYVKPNNPFSRQTTVIFDSMEKHTPFSCQLSKYLYYFVRANCKKYTWNFTNNWECCQNNIDKCVFRFWQLLESSTEWRCLPVARRKNILLHQSCFSATLWHWVIWGIPDWLPWLHQWQLL